MNQKMMKQFFFLFVLFVTGTLCLSPFSFGHAHANLEDPTPSPTIDTEADLQPDQTPEPDQPNSRLLQTPSLPAEPENLLATVQGQHTFYSISDAMVSEGYSTTNYGNDSEMWAGYDDMKNPDGEVVRSLVKFNISSLPVDEIVISATLRVYLVRTWDYPNTNRTIKTYRITGNWSENTVNWNNKPGYSFIYDSQSIGEDDFTWHEFDVTDLVSNWHNNVYPNYGIMLRGPEYSGSDSSWRGFGTKESSVTPQLIVVTDEAPPAQPPTAPSNLAATAVSQTKINLTWQDKSTDESAFFIERSPNGSTGWTQIDVVSANITGYSDTELNCSTTYYYRVRAYRISDKQYSDFSNINNTTTQACPSPLAAPSNLEVTAVSATQIDLKWQDNSLDETAFRIERSPDGATGWTEIASVGANIISYSDTGLDDDTAYHYRVRAYRAGDGQYSDYCTSINTTTRPTNFLLYLPAILNNAGPPSTPPVLHPIDNKDGDGSYTVNWSKITGATKYILQEDDNIQFSSPTEVYAGAGTSKTIDNGNIDTYYYRVKAANSMGSSTWSAIETVQVNVLGTIPKSGHWSGSGVSFTVTPDGNTIKDFTAEIDVYGCGTYEITHNDDMNISNGKFSSANVSGEFSTSTKASGNYEFSFPVCGGASVTVTSTWVVNWQHP